MHVLTINLEDAKKAHDVVHGLSKNIKFTYGDVSAATTIFLYDDDELDIVIGLLQEENVRFSKAQ